jgi:TamB, inner membrane protein subunit of TAM complex
MNLQGIKKRIVKILAYSTVTVLFLLIASLLILQLPSVQRYLTNRYLRGFSEVVGFKTTIQNINFSWFDKLELDGVVVEDPEHNKMFEISHLSLNYDISNLIQGTNINLDAIYIDSARVYFTRILERDTIRNLNINVFINQISKQYSSGKKGGASSRINIGEAVVEKSLFTYDNTGKDSLSGFDYNHFSLKITEAQLQNFIALGDTVEFNVSTLVAKDQKTKFGVNNLSSFFRISQKGLEFKGLHLQAGQSTISDTLIFNYNSQADLSDFVNNVNIEAHFYKTVIHPNDLALFAPAARRLSLPLILSGVMKGSISDFKLKDMDIRSGNSVLYGSIDMEGLPDIKETFIQLSLKNSRVNFNDISFIFSDATLKRLTPLGTLSLNGEFIGYPTDFVAKGNFSNQLGLISSDINLKIDEDAFEKSSYNGQISLTNFDLGTYLSDTVNFQKLNLDGSISGSGFSRSTANFKLIGNVRSVGIKKYNYRNITTDARFASQFFSGELKIKDPNVQVDAKGSIDLRDNRNLIVLQAKIDTLNLHTINLARQKLFIHGDVDLNMSGLTLDSLVGVAHIKNLSLNYRDQWLMQNDITLTTTRTDKIRSMRFQSEVVDAKAEGDFYSSALFRDIPVLVNEFIMNIRNDKARLAAYYAEKSTTTQKYTADFTIKLKDIKPVTSLLKFDLGTGKNIDIEGKFTHGNTNVLSAFTRIDSLKYGNILFMDTEIELNASKISDSTQALAMVYVSSEQQQIGNLLTKDLITEVIWNKDHIDFNLSLDQQRRNNYLRLNGAIDFTDSTYIRLLPSSRVQLLEKVWSVDAANNLAIKNKEINIQNFKWSNDEQVIKLNGHLSKDPEKKLALFVEQFNLSTLNSIIQRKLSGKVNAEVTVSDAYVQPSLQNEIDIRELKVDDFLVGDITGNNTWDPIEKKFKVEFLVDRLDTRIVSCTGYYDPYNTENALAITASLQKTNLKIIEPFLKGIFSNIEGTLTGIYSVTGMLQRPILKGEGDIEGGKLTVDYLKTTYQLDGKIGLRQNAIYFKNIQLSDLLRNQGKLNGEITHDNFSQMAINLGATFDNFQLLNTNARDNNLFYGQAFATGDVSFTGPLNNLKITANATTRKNTRISVPIAGTSSIERKDFIQFVNFSDSLYQKNISKQINKKINLTGITFDLNLDVTPEAYCEIIFDIKSGDIIHGRGNGKIKLQLDTKGEFNMFGPVVFTEGGYNFTLYDIINKEFKIESGSSITWYGDPYQGTMRINATYNQLASFGPILNDLTLQAAPQIRRKYPVKVVLKLDGPMLSPQIDFDILAPDLPKSMTVTVEGTSRTVRLAEDFQAFKSRLDEQELKRQVFSLIVLRKFSPAESFNTSGSLVNSVSELFSNQLSYWMSQVDNNLEIDLDLGSMDQESFNAFQLRLSYTLLNGRLRITRDGTFGNQGTNSTTGNTGTNPQANQGNFSSAVGDWTVDYLLTADGKFKVKMYSRTNVNPVNTNLNSQNAITTGVSLLYTQSFNELKDLWKRNKALTKPEDEDAEDEEVPPANNAVKKDESDE